MGVRVQPDEPGSRDDQCPQNARSEVMRLAGGQFIEDRDTDSHVSYSDRVLYLAENSMAAVPNFQFWVLGVFTLFLTLVLSVFWMDANGLAWNDGVGLEEAIWVSFQVLASQGYENEMNQYERVVFSCMILAGLVVFAILVGFITDAIQENMATLSDGRSKVSLSPCQRLHHAIDPLTLSHDCFLMPLPFRCPRQATHSYWGGTNQPHDSYAN